MNRSFQLERLGPDLSHEADDPFHVEIDHRRCVQRQQLRDAETADDRDAERTPRRGDRCTTGGCRGHLPHHAMKSRPSQDVSATVQGGDNDRQRLADQPLCALRRALLLLISRGLDRFLPKPYQSALLRANGRCAPEAAILLKAVLTHFGTSLARSANVQTNQELAWRLNQGSFSPHASQPPLDRSARL